MSDLKEESSGTDSDGSEMDFEGTEVAGSSSENEITVDFVVCDPSPVDFKSVRRLLERYLPGKEATFNASGMAEAVIQQVQLGSMVKVEGDLDAYGFATVLPLTRVSWLPRKGCTDFAC
jgi:hypothetical protein